MARKLDAWGMGVLYRHMLRTGHGWTHAISFLGEMHVLINLYPSFPYHTYKQEHSDGQC